MRKWLIALLLLCLIACAAAAEENSCAGSWVLTTVGDMPAAIGSEKLVLLENGEGIRTREGALTVVKWTAADGALDVAAGDEHTVCAFGDDGRLTAQDGRIFERSMTEAEISETAGVWALTRAVLGGVRVDPQDVNLRYEMTLLPDGTGLFSGDRIESAAVTWIARGGELHVHGDGKCMLFRIAGGQIETGLAQLDSSLIFSRTETAAEPAAEAGTTVHTTGDVNLRAGAGKNYDKIGVAMDDTELPYAGETKTDERGVDWYKVLTDDGEAWVSSQYAEIV